MLERLNMPVKIRAIYFPLELDLRLGTQVKAFGDFLLKVHSHHSMGRISNMISAARELHIMKR
jgi:hypothetical protein